MTEPVRVFVSHHHSPKEDAATARLVADLEEAGADVWVDYQGVVSGSFVQQINEGLSGRQWLVLVMTNAALGSPWVRDEVNATLHLVNLGRMRGVIPLMMTRCDDAHIPPLWAQLHRYDATKGYEAARDGLLRAMGLSLPAAKDLPKPPQQGVINEQGDADAPALPSELNQIYLAQKPAHLKTLDDLLSLTPMEFERAVMMMLDAHGYHHLSLSGVHGPSDIACGSPDGHWVYVWCRLFTPKHLVTSAQVLSAIGAASHDHRRAIVITTSGFTGHAHSEAKAHSDRITLIDGQQLVEMMQRVELY